MGDSPPGPVGVILAGGRGRRLGGDKALTELLGRPLISYPLAAMRAALAEVVIVAKAETRLPEASGVPVWDESAQPQHPLTGIVHALAMAGGRAVLVCAADMPFVTAAVLSALAEADSGGAPAVIAARDGRLQPLLGRYEPAALARLQGSGSDQRLRETVAALEPRLLEVAPGVLFNVNTSEDLARAQALLEQGKGGG